MLATVSLNTILFATLGGFLPSAIWLWFWLKEDHHPEPKRLIALTFLLGGLGVVAAFYLERAVAGSFDLGSLENVDIDFRVFVDGLKMSAPFFYLFLSWALIEEFLKYSAAKIAALRSSSFDEPVDAMIYLITAALGFAAIENALFLIKTVRLGLGGFEFVLNGNLRFIGATLLHIFCSALVGAFIGLSFNDSNSKQLWRTLLGLLLASVLHALFNFFIIIDKGQNIFQVLFVLWILTVLILLLFEKVKHKNTLYVQR